MAGVTLIELIVAMGILTILVSGILPLSYMTYKRSKEIELRQNLRVIRNAIDDYKKMVEDGRIAMELDGTGYPATLEILVEGVDSNDPDCDTAGGGGGGTSAVASEAESVDAGSLVAGSLVASSLVAGSLVAGSFAATDDSGEGAVGSLVAGVIVAGSLVDGTAGATTAKLKLPSRPVMATGGRLRSVAQLAEHRFPKPAVGGSSPSAPVGGQLRTDYPSDSTQLG